MMSFSLFGVMVWFFEVKEINKEMKYLNTIKAC